MSRTRRGLNRPLAESNVIPTPAIRSLHMRVMAEILTRQIVPPDADAVVSIAQLRIVILKSLAIAHRIGYAAGTDDQINRP